VRKSHAGDQTKTYNVQFIGECDSEGIIVICQKDTNVLWAQA